MPNQPKDQRVKHLGDEILNHVRVCLDRECKDDSDFRFLVNRWVHARLQQDYRKGSKRVKKALLENGMAVCQGRGPHNDNKPLEIHRLDESMGYSEENCIILCNACHKSKKK